MSSSMHLTVKACVAQILTISSVLVCQLVHVSSIAGTVVITALHVASARLVHLRLWNSHVEFT